MNVKASLRLETLLFEEMLREERSSDRPRCLALRGNGSSSATLADLYFGVLNRIRQCGHRCGADADKRVFMTTRRMAGSVGLGGPCLLVFFPLCLV